MPKQSHLINGKVYSIFKEEVEGATVSVVHSNGTIIITTNSKGEYMINLGRLSSWTRGDSLSITANKTGEGSKTETTTISSGGGQTQHLTLEEEEQVEGMDSESRAKINKVILIGYDKRDINRTNRLPTANEDVFAKYQLSGADDDNQLYGYVDRNGNWYIQKYVSSDKTYKYAKGSSDFSGNWSNRNSLEYLFFNEVF